MNSIAVCKSLIVGSALIKLQEPTLEQAMSDPFGIMDPEADNEEKVLIEHRKAIPLKVQQQEVSKLKFQRVAVVLL